MTNKIVLTAILVVILFGSISATTAFADNDKGKDNDKNKPTTLAAFCAKLKDKDDFPALVCAAISDLQNQINKIQLTPGPQGPPGPPGPPGTPGNSGPATPTMWINYLGFLSGDSTVTETYNGVNSGLGTGLPGLIVQSSTTGNTVSGGGNKVISMGLEVPPEYDVTGAVICYESSSAGTFIDDVRFAQLQSPPSTALVLLDSPQGSISGPQCVTTSPTTLMHPLNGQLTLDLRINTGSISDKIVIRGVGLELQHS